LRCAIIPAPVREVVRLFLFWFFFLALFRHLLRIVDHRNNFTDLYLLALGHFRFEHAGFFSDNIRGDLVRLECEKRFAFVHELARLFMPGGDDSAGHRLPNRRNFYLNDHCRDLPKLIERRGRGGFRQ